jgi:proliferating cell nuclear antigen PCNA
VSFKLVACKGVFVEFVSALNVLVEEAAFRIGYEGLTATVMDVSRTAILYIYHPKSLFTEYRFTAPQKIALNTGLLAEYLNRTTDDEILTLSRTEDNNNSGTVPLNLTAYNPQTKLTREWTLPQMTAPPDDPQTNEHKYTTQALFNAPQLTQRCQDLALVSDHITLTAKDEVLVLRTKSEIADGTITLPAASTDALLYLTISQPAEATYSAKYLTDIAKTAKKNNINALYATDLPIKLEIDLPAGKLIYWLAPRIIEPEEKPTEAAACPP